MPFQVRNTDFGIAADAYDLDARDARDMARKLIEAADALDPFPADEGDVDTCDDPPKCDECKGTGIDIVNQIDPCPQCLGSGY